MGQVPVDVFGRRGRSVMPHHATEALEPTLGRLVEDALDSARGRIEKDDGFALVCGCHQQDTTYLPKSCSSTISRSLPGFQPPPCETAKLLLRSRPASSAFSSTR